MKRTLQFFLVFLTLAGCNSNTEEVADESKDQAVGEEVVESSSTMIAPTVYSDEMKLDWNYTAYLPASYEEETEKDFPVLYLLHGAFGNHRNLVERFPIQDQLDNLSKEGKLDEMVVIFVDGFNSYYIDGPGLNMESAIMNDLVPSLENELGLHPTRDNRYVGGISMGGYGAANLVLRYPETFSKGILISPAVWYEMNEDIVTYDWHVFRDNNNNFDHDLWEKEHPTAQIDNFEQKEENVDFYVMTGKEDDVVPYKVVEQFVEDLSKSDYINIEAVYDDEGVHAWTFWENATKQALDEF